VVAVIDQRGDGKDVVLGSLDRKLELKVPGLASEVAVAVVRVLVFRHSRKRS